MPSRKASTKTNTEWIDTLLTDVSGMDHHLPVGDQAADIYEIFNNLGVCSFDPKKLSDLHPHIKYAVKELRSVETVFGRRVVCELMDGKSIFLPSRFKIMTDTQLQELSGGKSLLVYEGLIINQRGIKYHGLKLIPV